MAQDCKFSDIIEFFKNESMSKPGYSKFNPVFCRLLIDAACAEAASVWELNSKGQLRLIYGTNIDLSKTGTFSLEAGEGISGAVVLSQKTLSVKGVISNLNHSRKLDNIIDFKTQSMISAPIMYDGILYGVINILNYKKGKMFPYHWNERLSLLGLIYAQSRFSKFYSSMSAHSKRVDSNQYVFKLRSKVTVVGISPGIQKALHLALKAGRTDIPVLICGETGTGKELTARRIHEAMRLKDSPFLAVNCAALTETIMESELFGHVKGAFSGAVNNRKGKFIAASGGILFLDEIADMSLSCQAKILRAVQEKKVVPVGSEKEIVCDVRIVAATNKNLKELVQRGKFREDLYYRLCGLEIDLPPLRQRFEDIELLSIFFLNKVNKKGKKKFSKAAIEMLKSFLWPGNIRQLEQAVHAAVTICDDIEIHPEHFPIWLRKAIKTNLGFQSDDEAFHTVSKDRNTIFDQNANTEKRRYLEALQNNKYPATGRWNISATARELKIARKTLAYRMTKLNLTQHETNYSG